MNQIKGYIFISLLAGIIILMPFCVGAADDEFHATFGIDYWKADWEYTVEDSGGHKVDYDASGPGMFGPSVKLGYGDFFFGASYMIGKFELKDIDDKGERQDLLFSFGYNLGKHFAVRIQYEDYTYDHDLDVDLKREQKQTGFGVGVSGFTTLADTGVFVFGSLGYSPFGKAEDKLAGDKKDSDATKLSLDLGVGYIFEFPLSVSLGYRYSKTDTKDDILEATFRGITASISYTI